MPETVRERPIRVQICGSAASIRGRLRTPEWQRRLRAMGGGGGADPVDGAGGSGRVGDPGVIGSQA